MRILAIAVGALALVVAVGALLAGALGGIGEPPGPPATSPAARSSASADPGARARVLATQLDAFADAVRPLDGRPPQAIRAGLAGRYGVAVAAQPAEGQVGVRVVSGRIELCLGAEGLWSCRLAGRGSRPVSAATLAGARAALAAG